MGRLMRLVAALAAVLIVPALAYAQVTEPGAAYSFSVQARGEADVYEVVTGGRCRILTAGTFNTDATVYSDANLSTLATTLTVSGFAPTIALDANGVCKWYAASSVTSVDVIVYVDSGDYAGIRNRIDGVTRRGTKQTHFTRTSQFHSKTIPFTQNTSTQNSAVQLPAGAVVTAAVVETTTAAPTATVSFGGGGSVGLTAFCNASIAPASLGFTVCSAALAVNVGSTAVGLQYQTNNTAVAGFLTVWYLVAAGD